MTTEKFENFVVFNDVKSLSEVMASDVISDETAAVVIISSAEFQTNESEKKMLSECRFLTILYNSDFSAFSSDFLMLFDIRLSDNDYFITSESFKELNTERYRLLCGRTDTYRLVSNFSGRNAADYRSKLVKTLNSDETVNDYCTALFREKTPQEISGILKCIIAARSGSLEAVFRQESVNFYSMVREKVKGE